MKENILEDHSYGLEVNYNAILDTYNNFADMIYNLYINQPEVIDIFNNGLQAETEEKQNYFRKQLYEYLLPVYDRLQSNNFQQLHFHDAESNSYLRFHKPETYGDSLVGIRNTVTYVNEKHEPIKAFEEGRMFNGLRNVYPLKKDEKHLGSIEISIAISTILDLLSTNTGLDNQFIISKEIVEQKEFAEELDNYKPWPLSDSFLISADTVIERNISSFISSDEADKIVKYFEQNLHTELPEKVFSIPLKSGAIISVHAIDNMQGFVEGYLISCSDKTSLKNIETARLSSLLSTAFAFLFLILVYITVERWTRRLQKKTNTLEQVQRIGKMGSWEFDVKKNKLIWSDEIYIIFGIEPQSFEATYEAFFEYVHPDDRTLLDNAYKTSLENKTGYSIRHRILRQDETVLYVFESAYHEYNKSGSPIRSLGTVQDVTDLVEKEITLQNMKDQLEAAVNKVPDIIYTCLDGIEGKVTYINDAILPLTGYHASEFIKEGKSLRSIVHPEDQTRVEKQIREAIDSNSFFKLDYRILTSSNEIIYVEEIGRQIVNETGLKTLEGSISDVSLHKDTLGRMRKFLDYQDNIVVLTNGEKLLFANKSLFKFTGIKDLESFLKQYSCICDLFIENEDVFHLKKMKDSEDNWISSLLHLNESDRVVAIKNKERELHIFTVNINSYEHDMFLITFTDISENFFDKIRFKQNSLIDTLTGSYNREFFNEHIHKIIESHQKQNYKTGIIMLDIDLFKDVNDTYGHDVGDTILKQVSNILKNHIRSTDAIIRWGGDEFIIIAEIMNLEGLQTLAEHLRSQIGQFQFDSVDTLSCSFGITIHNPGVPVKQTLKNADTALYKAKENGKNRVEGSN